MTRRNGGFLGRTDPRTKLEVLPRQPNPQHRTCGNCNACCVALLIPELDKRPGVWCEHLVQIGQKGGQCSIYETRPEPCRKFRCLWLMGFFTAAQRPDRLGLVLWSPKELPTGHNLVVYAEARAGAAVIGPGAKFLAELPRAQPRWDLLPYSAAAGRTEIDGVIGEDGRFRPLPAKPGGDAPG